MSLPRELKVQTELDQQRTASPVLQPFENHGIMWSYSFTRGSLDVRSTPSSLQTRRRSIMVMVVWGLKNTKFATTEARATRNGIAPIAVSSLPSPPLWAGDVEVSAAAVKPATARQSRLNLKYASKSLAWARPKLSLCVVFSFGSGDGDVEC